MKSTTRQEIIGKRTAASTGSLEERIGRSIAPQPNGCWLFQGRPGKYGVFKLDDRSGISVHRFVYETLVGKIPADHHLHHTCRTKACCNPAHLQPLTPAEHRRIHAAAS